MKLKSHWKTANIHAWHGRIRAKLKKSVEHKYTMAWTRPRQVKKVIGTRIFVYQFSNDFLTWRGRVHAIYLCVPIIFLTLAWTRPCHSIGVPITFLTWRGRVHANNGMDESTPRQKSNWNTNIQWHGRASTPS